jgi:hypothetical protein
LALTPLVTLATEMVAVGGNRLQAPDDIAATLQALAQKAFACIRRSPRPGI